MTLDRREPSPWFVSLGAHAALGLVAALIFWLGARAPSPEIVEIEVFENPKAAPLGARPPPLPRAPELSRPAPPRAPEKRAVFGLSRRAMTDASPGGIEAKAGNTVAKAQDDQRLRAGDDDALPVPADEILVTSMPRLADEVRIPYPPEAKRAGVEGAVVMDLLVDDAGTVRQANLIDGPGHGLNEAALEAVRRFRFEPARIGDKKVAVRIRYAYRFVLER